MFFELSYFKFLSIQEMSYTPIERKQLKMGIYILPVQSIQIKISWLGVKFVFGFFTKIKNRFNPKTASFIFD